MASGALKTAAVSMTRVSFNGLYRLFGLLGRRDEVLFVSRKSGEPSYDYVECGKAFSAQGYEPVYLSQHLISPRFWRMRGLFCGSCIILLAAGCA